MSFNLNKNSNDEINEILNKETTLNHQIIKRRSFNISSSSFNERETWNQKLSFLLSVIGFAVDLSNVWRFPYLCYKNGGGAFLIPYCIMLAVGGIPLFFMELAIGQYQRKGAISSWGQLVPLFKGIGYTMVMIAFYVDLYYNLLIAWALHFFFASFNLNLPWTKCDQKWNTNSCESVLKFNNFTKNTTSAAEEYFNRGLLGLHQSSGIDDLGRIKWDIAFCLFLVYLICYFSIWKGISTSSKVIWFTALFPYFVLVMLLINSCNLPGAKEGILYYITPDFSKLNNANVWVDAATQVFFSLGPGFGVLLAFASYNQFHNNVYRDALITSAVNSATSFLSGFVIFSVLGYMAHKLNKDVAEIAVEGPGLVFIVYPEAIATMPASPFWSVMFFLMLLTLGLDSSFGGSESIITALSDEFELIRKNREKFIAILFTFYFIVGLATCTEGGVYIFQLLDSYAAGYSILVTVLFEAIAISWIYGIKRFSNDLKEMLGFEIGIWWKFCWVFIAPLFLMSIIIYGLINYEPIRYQNYVYPKWANLIGWFIAFSSMLCIPIMACYQLIKAKGSLKERFKICITPLQNNKSSNIEKTEMKTVEKILKTANENNVKKSVYV